jgi:hypothetical protein
LTINIFNKTTVSCAESLDPGPEAHAGLHQGVPGKEPHQLLYLLGQITGFVARLCIDPLIRDATYKTDKRVAARQAGKPDLLHLHLRKVLFEPVLHPLAVLGRAAVLLGDFQLSKYHPLIQSSHICPVHLDKFVKLFFSIVSSALFDVSIAHNLFTVRPARSSQTITAFVASC